MATARYKTVEPGKGGVYHCRSRCVRRCFLCGEDPLTGQSYEHRKGWVESRLRFLSEIFEFPVYSYAVMSNHLHVVLRTAPERAAGWSAEEVIRKAYKLCPHAVSRELGAGEPLSVLLKRAKERQDYVELWRERLGDLSWFMRFLNEHIARRANREDQLGGRFWEGRFRCSLLADEGAVLSCMAYVDLNPVRAGLGEKPEDCPFTAVYRRIEARRGRQRLTVLETSEEGNAKSLLDEERHRSRAASWLCPVEQVTVGNRDQAWGLGEEQYLKLVDFAGRAQLADKPGAIPAELAPILERLELDADQWARTVRRYGSLYWKVAGHAERLAEAAVRVGQRWLRAAPEARWVYISG